MEGMRDMKGWREDLYRMKEEVKEGIKEQGRMMREEIEEMREEFMEKERHWKEERKELREYMKKLGKVMSEMEGEKKGRMKKMRREDKVRRINGKINGEKRKRREKNVVIRGMDVKEGKRREAVDELLGSIETRVKVDQVRKIRGGAEREEIVLVELGNEEQKWEILEKELDRKEGKAQ